jgi:hypothetical protein
MSRFLKLLFVGAVFGGSAVLPAHSADVGVLKDLDVCSSLGLTGLTISSDTNCLQISGEVKYEFIFGDYRPPYHAVGTLASKSDPDGLFMGNGRSDWRSSVDTQLRFVGTSDSDFGKAQGVIRIDGRERPSHLDGAFEKTDTFLKLEQAYVTVGNGTVLSAGRKGTIANKDDDTAFTYQKLFNEDAASGVSYNSNNPKVDMKDGGHVIQIVHNLGGGWSVGAAAEKLDTTGTAVGVVSYASKTITAHATVLASDMLTGTIRNWGVHAGATVTIDKARLRGAIAFNDAGWWNALATASYNFDGFTLAVAGEATSASEYGFAGSIAAQVLDGITLNVGSRMFREGNGDVTIDTIAAIKSGLAEALTLELGAGYISESEKSDGTVYGLGKLAWAPGGGFTADLEARVNHNPAHSLGYQIKTTAKKTFN